MLNLLLSNPTTHLALLLLVLVGGCSTSEPREDAVTVLRNAATFELLSLDPLPSKRGDSPDAFHGWTVLGEIDVVDPAVRDELVDALEAGIAENDGMAAACFEPRHGIRVTQNGVQYDFVICFECFSARWYAENVQKKGFLLTGSPQPVFDRVLTDASIALPAAPVR